MEYKRTPSSPVMVRICSFVYLYIYTSSSLYISVCINLSVYRYTSVPITSSIHPHVSISLYILIFCANSLGSLLVIDPSIARQKTHNFCHINFAYFHNVYPLMLHLQRVGETGCTTSKRLPECNPQQCNTQSYICTIL